MLEIFRNKSVASEIVKRIKDLNFPGKVRIMHVCGTHEQTIAKFGLRKLLPPNIKIICGPGCPVCCETAFEIDFAVQLAFMKNLIITSFGDMYRVPGSSLSLSDAKSRGGDVRVVY